MLDNVNVNTFIQDYLMACGVQEEDFCNFITGKNLCLDSPFSYPNMDKAINVLRELILKHEDIAVGVVVDSDADGYLSACIITDFLMNLGLEPLIFMHDGKQHGLNDLVEEILEEELQLLFVPDAGTNDVDECKKLSESGVQVIILDHHEIEQPNKHAIVINNHSDKSLNQHLSGTGVTYKFVQAYCDTFGAHMQNYAPLVGVSITSDICSAASQENRWFVEKTKDGFKDVNPAIEELTRRLAKDDPSPSSLGWNVIPKINALSRCGTKESKLTFFGAMLGLEDPDLAYKTGTKAHRTQTDKVKPAFEECLETMEDYDSFVFAITDISNRTFTGLIANKISSKLNKPAFVVCVNEDKYDGSVRSPYPVASIVNSLGVAKCSGHEEACGVEMEISNYDSFAKSLTDYLADDVQPLVVTATLKPKNITKKLCEICGSKDYQYLWGKRLEEPTFYIEHTFTKNEVNIFKKKTNTLKLSASGVSFMKFRISEDLVEEFESKKIFTLAMIVKLDLNEYNGDISCQAMIEDMWFVDKNSRAEEDDEDVFADF